jgi:hypothetical protein
LKLLWLARPLDDMALANEDSSRRMKAIIYGVWTSQWMLPLIKQFSNLDDDDDDCCLYAGVNKYPYI